MSLSLKNTDHTVKMPFTITFKSLHIHQWVNERSPASGVTAKGTGSLVPIFTESMKQGNLGTAHSLPINLFCMCFLPLFPDGTVVKNLPANVGDARDTGLISGLGRSPGVGNGNPLQYFCLENPIDRGAWWVIESMGSERVGHDWAHVHAHTHKQSREVESSQCIKFFLMVSFALCCVWSKSVFHPLQGRIETIRNEQTHLVLFLLLW